MTDLAELFRAEGIRVREIGAWRSHVRPGTFKPVGVMVHHTGDKGQGDSGLDVLRYGRPDLNGPLCNASPRDDGTLALLSAGRANHAGAGSKAVLDRITHDLAPRGRAADLGLADDLSGANGLYYGLEVDNAGDGSEPYPTATIDTTVRACTALCREHRWTANRVLLHAEHTARKVDWSLPAVPLRAAVADRLRRAVLHDGIWTLPEHLPVHATSSTDPTPTQSQETDMVIVYAPGKPTCLLAGGKLTSLASNAEVEAYRAAGITVRRITPQEFTLLEAVSGRVG